MFARIVPLPEYGGFFFGYPKSPSALGSVLQLAVAKQARRPAYWLGKTNRFGFGKPNRELLN
jgi:hypothetical protein